MSVTKLGETAFKVGGGGDRKRRFGRLKISPQKRQVADTDSKKMGFKCKNPWLCGQLPPKQLGQMQLFIGGPRKKATIFFLPQASNC